MAPKAGVGVEVGAGERGDCGGGKVAAQRKEESFLW